MEKLFINKKAIVEFNDGRSYQEEYFEDGTFRWKSLENPDLEGTQPIEIFKIFDGIYSLNWVTDKGNTVSMSVDLNEGTVVEYLTKPDDEEFGKRKVITEKGTYKFVDEEAPITNKQRAVDFWNRFFNDHDETAIDDYLAAPYTQHNPYVPDGIAPFRDYFVNGFRNELKNHHSEIKEVAVTKDKVFIHNLVTNGPDDLGTAAVDIFRFENGKIVEHWDVLQSIPEEAANDHPMF